MYLYIIRYNIQCDGDSLIVLEKNSYTVIRTRDIRIITKSVYYDKNHKNHIKMNRISNNHYFSQSKPIMRGFSMWDKS